MEHVKVVKVGLLWFFSQQGERQLIAIIIKASFAYCGTLKLFWEVAKTFYSQTMMSFGSAGFGWMAFLRLCVCASRLRHGHRHTAFTDEFWVTWWQQPPSPHSVVSHPTLEENVSSSSVACTCANGRASVWAFQPRTTSMSHRQPDGGIYLVRANYFQKLKTTINWLLFSFLKAQSDSPFLCLCPSFVWLQQIMERCRKQSNTCNFVGAFMPFEMAIKYTICPFLTTPTPLPSRKKTTFSLKSAVQKLSGNAEMNFSWSSSSSRFSGITLLPSSSNITNTVSSKICRTFFSCVEWRAYCTHCYRIISAMT